MSATVLVIGSGAREHAISCAYEKSPHVGKIVVAPGNDFMRFNRKKEVVTDKDCKLNDAQSLLAIARKYRPNLVDVAQDDALACGAVDLLRSNGFRAFGPSKQAARIEWDKKWSRDFMTRHGVPAPKFKYFNNEDSARDYVKLIYEREPNKLLFVKAAGLCAGKGALKARSLSEALSAVEAMKSFGEAGRIFLIEEGLVGEEFSYYAISDGKSFKTFKSAQDNKTVFDGDQGSQTGGMGVVSPALVTKGREQEIEREQIGKIFEGFWTEVVDYHGILYLGGIMTQNGVKNIEYNARWGDPECQAVLPSVLNDYHELVNACVDGKLRDVELKQDGKTRVCVVGASKGYPGDYSQAKGKQIFGLEDAATVEGVSVYGAGIVEREGKFYANGGRLFSVVAEGKDTIDARNKAYRAIALVSVEGDNLHYRLDIGWRDVKRLKKTI